MNLARAGVFRIENFMIWGRQGSLLSTLKSPLHDVAKSQIKKELETRSETQNRTDVREPLCKQKFRAFPLVSKRKVTMKAMICASATPVL